MTINCHACGQPVDDDSPAAVLQRFTAYMDDPATDGDSSGEWDDWPGRRPGDVHTVPGFGRVELVEVIKDADDSEHDYILDVQGVLIRVNGATNSYDHWRRRGYARVVKRREVASVSYVYE